uniref:Uncharacterized protein n=1 Tax=Meloidogyne enterolobii TaxID=390850 RepID=A0A6V7W672_MELEN|nr:unnamed protein product [Meloidogyne enterolobii]
MREIEKILNEIKLLDKGKKNKSIKNNNSSKNKRNKQNKTEQIFKGKNKIIEETEEENNKNLFDDDKKIEEIEYILNTEGVIEKIMREKNTIIKNDEEIGKEWKINLGRNEMKRRRMKEKEEKRNKQEENQKISEDEEEENDEQFNVFPLDHSWNNHLKLDHHKYFFDGKRGKNKLNFEEKELRSDEGKLNEVLKEKEIKIEDSKQNEALKEEESKNDLPDFSSFYPKIFLDNDKVDELYIELINSNNQDNERKLKLLNVGAFVEEIKNRIEYVKKIKQKFKTSISIGSIEVQIDDKNYNGFNSLESFNELEQEFNKILEENFIPGNKSNLENKLHNLLREFVMIIDGWMMIKSENEGDINNNDIIPVKSMLHRHRLASLINNPALNQINDYQKNILVSLLGNFTSQEFEVFLQNYKLKIKQKLLTYEHFEMEFTIFLELPFSFAQKINAENSLAQVIKEKFQNNNESDSYNSAINYLKSIISEWAKKVYNCIDIELLLSGSKLLNTDIVESDVDGIVILNKNKDDGCKINELNQFIGNTNVDECKNFEKVKESEISLFCLLYNQAPIHQLRKNIHTRIKIIEFILFKIKFDISFVILEDIMPLKLNKFIQHNNFEIEKIIEKLEELQNLDINENKIKEIHGEILTLASYNSNKIIKNIIVKSANLNKFTFLTKTLKLWAKSKFFK